MAERVLGAAPGLPGLYARVVADSLPFGRRRGSGQQDSGSDTGSRTGSRSGSGVDSDSSGPFGPRLHLPGVTVDVDRLAAYRGVCGFRDVGARTLPATYPHVLAFGLHLSVMSDARFPFPPLGAVHIANRISQLTSIDVGQSLELTVSVEDLVPHARGRQVTLVTEATASGALVWRADTVLLHREAGAEQVAAAVPVKAGSSSVRPTLPSSAPQGPASWHLPAQLGRRYARVSGDINPIHLYDATARLFGFRRHIAHGMWTKAACLAALGNRLDDAFTVDVVFRRPISLPGTVRFGARGNGSALDFGVSSPAVASEVPATHLVGRVTPG